MSCDPGQVGGKGADGHTVTDARLPVAQDLPVADRTSAPDAHPTPDAPTTADLSLPDLHQPDMEVDNFCQGGDVVLRDKLWDGQTSGQRSGGSFTQDGWRTGSSSDQLYWDLGQTVAAGSITFDAQGLHKDVGGCFWGVCYYVGLFEEANGDKRADYTGSAFIESRYHTDDQENFHDTLKIQSGDGSGGMSEPMIPPGLGWSASDWHSFRIEWGGGSSSLFIDGSKRLTSSYSTSRAISWRHLFMGTTNYKGSDWGATGVTYRGVCLRRQ